MDIAQRIKAAREKSGLSQSEAANAWGINPHTLQGWEIGRHSPRGFALNQLEKLLAEILDAPAGAGAKRRRPGT